MIFPTIRTMHRLVGCFLAENKDKTKIKGLIRSIGITPRLCLEFGFVSFDKFVERIESLLQCFVTIFNKEIKNQTIKLN
jgi:hypothetical protein